MPIIDRYEQQPGQQYAARDVQCLPDGLALHMAAAYPVEAGVQRCQRTMRLAEGRFILRDEIVCAEVPVTWVFMLRHEPEIMADGCVLKSGFRIRWGQGLSAQAEPIDITDGRMKNSYPGTLWRLTLTAEASAHHTQEFLFEA